MLLLGLLMAAVQSKEPTPDVASQKRAEKGIRETLKTEYSRRDKDGRRALGRLLLRKGTETKDDSAVRYVFLRESKDVAAEALDLATAFAAIRLLAERYEVDAGELRAAATASARKAIRTTDEASDVADFHLSLAEDGLEASDFAGARAAAKEAEQIARAAKDESIAARAKERGKEIAEIQQERELFDKAMETFRAHPGDPEANLTCGRFLCFVRGEWEKGLSHLAHGADAALARVAEQELSKPDSPEARASLAESWWDLARKARGEADKARYLDRAHFRLRDALSTATGLAESKMRTRLGLLEKEMTPKGSIDLLSLINLRKDALVDSWTRSGASVLSPTTAGPRLQIPYLAPPEYDLTVIASGKEPRGALLLGLVVGEKHVLIGLDLLEGFSASCVGHITENGDTVVRGKVFQDEKPRVVVCSVRRTQVTVTVDRKKLIDWKVDPQRITGSGNEIPNKRALYLGTHFGNFRIEQVQLLAVTGAGKPLR